MRAGVARPLVAGILVLCGFEVCAQSSVEDLDQLIARQVIVTLDPLQNHATVASLITPSPSRAGLLTEFGGAVGAVQLAHRETRFDSAGNQRFNARDAVSLLHNTVVLTYPTATDIPAVVRLLRQHPSERDQDV